jgi:uncharacterized protein YjbJ (UPF0337 family)
VSNENQGRETVDAQSDKAKGRLKEAAGDLTGNKRLKHEGQADRAGGNVKDKVGKGIEKTKDVVMRKR